MQLIRATSVICVTWGKNIFLVWFWCYSLVPQDWQQHSPLEVEFTIGPGIGRKELPQNRSQCRKEGVDTGTVLIIGVFCVVSYTRSPPLAVSLTWLGSWIGSELTMTWTVGSQMCVCRLLIELV